ncbi:recombinase [Cytobacillus firmus]|uniref:Site-specific recombinase n=1 Tax=Cytobacillus firmus TaxID=1399 RepID=A0A380XFE6_CYTFI|nr:MULTISPECIES: recombinase family protein [Bacillaceae]KAF0824767.1 Site-specific recombinase [Cytobacillus firmus]MBG9544295.1 recombinase [Cytobacillus firmus]MBG9554740.1 recombinase [Cytobacillus firmus]MBG9559027.1 recombinase [Cytobacillus firmus]MBG9574439.1 recombinase [Cytobacillus firmus]
MRVAGYIRVSTNKEGQKESPENQKQMILDFITENHFDLFDFYTDVQTGTTDNREGLKRLIQDAENKEFDVIIAKELSRLGRNVELLYQLRRVADNKGVRLITLDGKVDTQDFSKQAMFGLYAWIYESESQRISDRIKSVFHMKYKNGKFLGSIPPYGYELKDKRLVIRDDYTVDIVRDIFNKYLEGWGHDKIARYLTNRDIPTPSQVVGKSNAGLYWQGSTVKKILKNPHYVGDLVQGRETTMNVTNKTRRVNDQSEWITISDAHKPIISRDMFEQVQSLLEQKAKRGRGGTRKRKHLFTNIAYCSDCGKAMHYRINRKGYICGSYAKHGKKACSSHVIKEQLLKEIILDDLKKMADDLEHPNLESKIEKRVRATAKQNESRLQSIEKQIQKQMELKHNALQKYIADDISKQDYDDFVNTVQGKLQQFEIEKAEIKRATDEKKAAIKISAILEQLKAFLNFNALTTEMLLRFVERIEVTESKDVKIYYKFAQVEGL